MYRAQVKKTVLRLGVLRVIDSDWEEQVFVQYPKSFVR